jgi:N-acyl-D-aspartate/D-glutamate deacylase
MSAGGAIQDGRIVAIGEVGKDAPGIVDAGGLALMPGIIDLHTHYDAQVTWDPMLSPSPSLGVTTAVMGNCGFGIVPSPSHLRDLIMRNLAVGREWISMRCAPASTGGSSPLPNT